MKFPVINLAGFFYRILETLFKKRIATDISFLLVAMERLVTSNLKLGIIAGGQLGKCLFRKQASGI
jgi:hypothetical protein